MADSNRRHSRSHVNENQEYISVTFEFMLIAVEISLRFVFSSRTDPFRN